MTINLTGWVFFQNIHTLIKTLKKIFFFVCSKEYYFFLRGCGSPLSLKCVLMFSIACKVKRILWGFFLVVFFRGFFFYKVALAVNQDISYASILKVSSEHLR